MKEWVDYFKELLEGEETRYKEEEQRQEGAEREEIKKREDLEIEEQEESEEIMMEEVGAAIGKIKHKKAAGFDETWRLGDLVENGLEENSRR